MPAKSKSQKNLMSVALAYKKGNLKQVSDEIKSIADSMSEKDLEDFVNTANKNLPEKIKENKYKTILNILNKIEKILERRLNGNFKNL